MSWENYRREKNKPFSFAYKAITAFMFFLVLILNLIAAGIRKNHQSTSNKLMLASIVPLMIFVLLSFNMM